MQRTVVESVLTCPDCGFAAVMTMPTDRCVVVHECAACGVRVRPKRGDCCVFCSYGSVKCPPIARRSVKPIGKQRFYGANDPRRGTGLALGYWNPL